MYAGLVGGGGLRSFDLLLLLYSDDVKALL